MHNIFRPEQDGYHFADGTFKYFSWKKSFGFWINSLKKVCWFLTDKTNIGSCYGLVSSGNQLCMACTKSDQGPGLHFNIKVSPYHYGKSHCGDKTVVRSSYLYNGISYTGKMASLYSISPHDAIYHHKATMGTKCIAYDLFASICFGDRNCSKPCAHIHITSWLRLTINIRMY